ncbi:MAG: copper homeostasis protein CutC [Bacteroides sp.]|nr:copper homeostasis protein CutC [Bacteroides sp.]MCM1085172.1 copper homeostasis protein CutC [Bacteroides sp.]
MFAKREDFTIEVCANSVNSVLAARQAGADRVELCMGMPEGGTTPSYGCIAEACAAGGIKVNVIVRPRGGDFLYDEVEKKVMLRDIRMLKDMGVDGVVTGMLRENGSIDGEFLRQCVREAAPLPVTFHRAFDRCADPMEALSVLEDCGVVRLLTSGQRADALQGADLIARLVQKARHLAVMPGCGVSAENIAEIARRTGAREFHLSGKVRQESAMTFRHKEFDKEEKVSIDGYAYQISGVEKISAAIEALL